MKIAKFKFEKIECQIIIQKYRTTKLLLPQDFNFPTNTKSCIES